MVLWGHFMGTVLTLGFSWGWLVNWFDGDIIPNVAARRFVHWRYPSKSGLKLHTMLVWPWSRRSPHGLSVLLSARLIFLSYLSVRQLLQALPSRPLSNGYVQHKRLLSSPSSPKKEVLQSIKRYSKLTVHPQSGGELKSERATQCRC